MVDADSLIVAALAAGAASAAQDGASEAVKEANARLRDAARGRLAGRPDGELALDRHETAPDTWRAPLAAELLTAGAGADAGLVAAARALLALVGAAGSQASKDQVVTVTGAQAVQVGDHNTQSSTLGSAADHSVAAGQDVHISASGRGITAGVIHGGVFQGPAGMAHDLDGLYLRAIDQLGNEQEPVRIGALHALSRLGQNNPSLRQSIMEVICAYLRMPYSGPDESPAPDPGVLTSLRKELQVRLTAQGVVADHLRDDMYRGQRHDAPVPETFWPEIEKVDLRGAYLMDLNLSGCRIRALECHDAIFAGESLFRGFVCDLAFFYGAAFKGFADFRGAVFANDTWFSGAAFAGDVWFHGDEFFPAARFGRHADFRQVTFGHEARFEQAIFEGSADFEAITCKSGTTAINLNGCQVHHPDAVNPDVSKAPSTWPPGWYIEPRHDGTATVEKLNTGTRSEHSHTWPATYNGKVWIQILPAAENSGGNHEVKLQWGPWQRHVNATVGPAGLTLTTSKATEERAVPCGVQVTPGARVLFGVSDVPSGAVLDIEIGWTRD